MIDVTINRITVGKNISNKPYDIEIYDKSNDYSGLINKEDIGNYIDCLYRIYNKYKGSDEDSVKSDIFIRSECDDLLRDYMGNWIATERIPAIINVVEEFKAENALGGFNKENILNNIDNIKLSQLHRLVQVIKRKEKANETSRN